MGPAQVMNALKDAVALGVDDVILLSDRAFAGADSLATSYALAKAIEKIGGVDLVITGKQAIDGDTAQVGPGIAEALQIPHSTYVKHISYVDEQVIRVERMIEGGYEEIEMDLPALITVVKEINTPRMPSIRGILRTLELEIPVWSANDIDAVETKIGLKGSPTQVVTIATPDLDVTGEIFTGKVDEQVQKLFDALRERKIV
jgi:electron transfer flavoprotein beta subunit